MSPALRRVLLVAALGGVVGLAAAGRIDGRADAAPAPVRAHAVDVGFAQFMSRHHDQAVVMSQIVQADPDSRVAGLAGAMASAQLLEMGQMRGWLSLWGEPWLPRSRAMGWLLLGASAPDAEFARYLLECEAAPSGMPGLASSAELEQLRGLRGAARDRLWLRLMIRHHQGGLPMARFAAREAREPAVRALAAQIVLDQARELERMVRLAAAADAG